jgi:hypothetical protein
MENRLTARQGRRGRTLEPGQSVRLRPVGGPCRSISGTASEVNSEQRYRDGSAVAVTFVVTGGLY